MRLGREQPAGESGVNAPLLCEPNLSEGRDPARVERLAAAVSSLDDVELIHCSADPDHNRMVLAYLGDPLAVLAATKALAAAAFLEIDLRQHEGRHPRLGALDVVPFVADSPIASIQHDRALEVCRAFARWVGRENVPVYLYEDAATAPHRRPLPAVRRGGFEGLTSKMLEDDWRPDFGPGAPHETAGAVITGVRGPLVRFNVNLGDPDPAAARRIAVDIREANGGLASVRALGLELSRRGLSQVTVNLTDYRRTPLADVHAAIVSGAARQGVEVVGLEVIGPIPSAALAGVSDGILDVLEPGQVLEHNRGNRHEA